MDREAVIRHLGKDWTETQALMREALDTDIELLRKVNETVLSHKGKQLRPMLSLLFARACTSSPLPRRSICYAAGAELLHNATLIHDDVADESYSRRGFPTVLSMMGPSVAVLLGDFWLARAVVTFSKNNPQQEVNDLFAKTLEDLAQGELLQLEKAEKADTDEAAYLRIIYYKTASLFEASCVSGAYSVDAPRPYIDAARKYAVALGLAFQIKDDILDYIGEPEIGKPLGSDLRERKITMPLLGAFRAKPSEEQRIREMIRGIGENPAAVDEIRAFVLENGGVEYAEGRLEDYIREALEALSAVPDSMSRRMLEELARYNSSRTV